MFKKISLFIVIAALAGFVAQSAQAIIVRGEIWRKQRSDGTYKMVYCLYDFHGGIETILSQKGCTEFTLTNLLCGTSRASQEQKKQWYDILSKFVKDETMVLVEDMYSDTNDHSIHPKKFEKMTSEEEFLLGLTQGCIGRDIPVINLECRQRKGMMFLYLSFKNADQIIDSLKQSTPDLENETDEAIYDIESYRSGPFLDLYNAKELVKYKVLRKNFMEQVYADKHYDIYLVVRRDSCLLDIKAINEIHMSDKKHIALAMGANHIKNIVTVLSALGYEKVHESGCTNEDINRTGSIELLNLDESVEAFDTLFNHARIFDIANFMGDNQSLCISNSEFNEIKQKPVNVLDPDKLLVSIVRNYPTRFPFCLLLPKVAQYLKEEEQRQRQEHDKLLVSMVSKYPTRFPFCLLLPKVAKYLQEEEQSKRELDVDISLSI